MKKNHSIITFVILIICLSACSQNKVNSLTSIDSEGAAKTEASIDKMLEKLGLPSLVKKVLTKEQITRKYKDPRKKFNLTQVQADNLADLGFSFLDNYDEDYKQLLNQEQLNAIRLDREYQLSHEQKLLFEEIDQSLVAEAAKKCIQPGSMAPNFELVDSAGNTRQLSEFRGKHILIDFWGTWCPPCIDELPKLAKVYQLIGKNKLEIIGICNECPDFNEFLDGKPFNWIQLNDPERCVAKDYGVSFFPSMFLIDPNGKVLETPFTNQEALLKDKLGTIKKYIK
jgi:peroxiredoxin